MRKSDVAIELAPYEGLSSYGLDEAIDEVIRLVNGVADSRVFPGCSHRWEGLAGRPGYAEASDRQGLQRTA